MAPPPLQPYAHGSGQEIRIERRTRSAGGYADHPAAHTAQQLNVILKSTRRRSCVHCSSRITILQASGFNTSAFELGLLANEVVMYNLSYTAHVFSPASDIFGCLYMGEAVIHTFSPTRRLTQLFPSPGA